ncbi:MAG: ANTAR domain-containing response regulator [Sulfuricaulis sp.]
MTHSSTKKRILIADDDPIIQELLEKMLTNAGYETFVAGSGEQAVEIATTNNIDLALLDYRMPGLSGLETGRALLNLTSTRFVLMSVCSDRDLIQQAAGEGALHFLAKPLTSSEVLNTLSMQLARAQEIKGLKKSIQELEANSAAISRAVSSARSVNTAIGLLMERYKKTRDLAYSMLMGRARSERRRAVDLSEEIIKASEAAYVWDAKASNSAPPGLEKE